MAALSYSAWQYFARQVHAAGLPPFDLHLYSHAQALIYLAALTPAAKAIYLGPLHSVDLALLISLTATLILPVWRRGWLWLIPALTYGGCDLAENAIVTTVLTQAAPDAGTVAQLATLTGVKFAALAVGAMAALWSLWQRRP